MKFSVVSSELYSKLSAVVRVVLSKPTIAAYEYIKMDLSYDALKATASDGDNTVTASIPVSNVEGEGSFLVKPKNIFEPIKDLASQELSIDVDDNSYEVTVSYSNGRYSFIGLDATDFPISKYGDNVNRITIPSAILLKGVASTLFAVSKDELRPIMNGVCVEVCQDCIKFVASDSKKLVRFIANSIDVGFIGSFVMPAKVASLVKSTFRDPKSDCIISFDSKNICMSSGDYIIMGRLIEGKYPRYEMVIPKNNTNRLVVDRTLLLSALRRVGVFSNSSTNLIKFDISNDNISLSSSDVDYSTSGSEVIPCEYKGTPMAIGFKASYAEEVLNTISSREVLMLLGEPSRAGLVYPVSDNNKEDLLILLMPMQL